MKPGAWLEPNTEEPDAGAGSSARPSGRLVRLLAERELWALGLLQLLLFWRPLFGGTAFFRDLHLLAFWVRRRAGEMLAAGELPFWDPYLHAGQPLFGSPTHSVAYPTVLLQVVLPPTAAFNAEIVLHLALCGLGAYLAARVLRLGPGPALVAAIVFELAGCTLALTNLLNRTLAFPHLPLAFAFWHLHLREGRLRWLGLAAVSCALMGLAGFPELVVLAFAFLLGWGLVAEEGRGRRGFVAGRWAVLGLTSAGIAAFQLLPAVAYAAFSQRGAGLPAVNALTWSVHPLRLLELAFPGLLGRPDLVGDLMWGLPLEGGLVPYLVSVYAGFPALLLALAGARGDGAPGGLARGVRVVLAGTVVAGVLLSLGRHLPGVEQLFEAVPRLGVFRFPVKALVATVLPLSLLAGAGARRLFWNGEGGGARRRVGIVVLACAALLLVVADSDEGVRALFFLLFGGVPQEEASDGFRACLLHGALALAAIGALLAWPPGRGTRTRRVALLALLVADLGLAGRPALPVADRSLFDDEPRLAAAVREVAAGGALYRTEDRGPVGFPPEARTAAWLSRWGLEVLVGYTAAGFGVPVALHQNFDGLLDRDRAALSSFVAAVPWGRRVPVLEASGVRAVLTADPPPIPGLEHVRAFANASSRLFHLYRVPGAEPPERFVTRWRPARTVDDAITGLVNGRQREVVQVVGAGAPGPCPGSEPRPSVVGRSARRAAWEVDTPCPGLLLTTIPALPGWRAEVDGAPVAPARARGIHLAIPVPAGRHSVRLSYLPPGLLAGGGLTAATLLLWAGLLLRRRRSALFPWPLAGR